MIKNNKQGFTLLELLVAVLIIGILAAIALPQYQLAKDKAEFAKYQSTVASLRDAYVEYVMLHGAGTKNFSDLSFTLPDDFKNSYSGHYHNCVSNNSMFCCITKELEDMNPSIECGTKNVIYIEQLFNKKLETKPRKRCIAALNNTRANKLCSSLGEEIGQVTSWIPGKLVTSAAYKL